MYFSHDIWLLKLISFNSFMDGHAWIIWQITNCDLIILFLLQLFRLYSTLWGCSTKPMNKTARNLSLKWKKEVKELPSDKFKIGASHELKDFLYTWRAGNQASSLFEHEILPFSRDKTLHIPSMAIKHEKEGYYKKGKEEENNLVNFQEKKMQSIAQVNVKCKIESCIVRIYCRCWGSICVLRRKFSSHLWLLFPLQFFRIYCLFPFFRLYISFLFFFRPNNHFMRLSFVGSQME